MISSKQWQAYNEAVAGVTERARADVESRVLSWLGEHPDADAAEARAASIRIMRERIGDWGRAASSLAADWYDAQGREAGARLDRAVTEVTYTDADIERVARYQVEKFVAGNKAAFARSCGDYALDVAKRCVNATVLKNARRDRSRGVRFARVTSGRNTCAFCLMLAGRGAVYWSRKTAGEFNHWHTHCSCKVVPGFSGDPHEVLVEGYDPAKIEARLKQVEDMTGTRRNTPEFAREVALRDPDWLFGDEAKTDYSLNPIESYGNINTPGDYSPENITDRGNEWRDLWVHHVLEKSGMAPQVHGKDDIDLTINGEWWEVKSPDEAKSHPGSGSDLRYIEKNLRQASHQFEKRGLGPAHVVFNPRYRHDASDEKLIAEVRKRMTQHRVAEVLFIKEDGSILRLSS